MYFKLLKDEGLTQKKLNSSSLVNNATSFTTINQIDEKKIRPMVVEHDFTPTSYLYKKADTLITTNYYKTFNFNDLYSYKNLYKLTDLAYVVKPAKNFGFYDFSPIDDSMNFSSNLLDSIKIKPLRFIRGVLNKHNIDILQSSNFDLRKNIIFVAKFSKQSGSLETKVDDCEVL